MEVKVKLVLLVLFLLVLINFVSAFEEEDIICEIYEEVFVNDTYSYN